MTKRPLELYDQLIKESGLEDSLALYQFVLNFNRLSQSQSNLDDLKDGLNALLADEDLTDEKLQDAAEGLLPNIADYLNKQTNLLNKDKLIIGFFIDVSGLSNQRAAQLLSSAMNRYRPYLESDNSIMTIWLASDQTKVEALNIKDISPDDLVRLEEESNKLSKFLEKLP